MNSQGLVDSATANYQYAVAQFMIKAQVDCFNKCLVDFQTRHISAMEQMCTADCVRKSQVAIQEMKSTEYATQIWARRILQWLLQ